MAQPAEVLREWHDPFMLVGTASATLIGLLFVAASVGSSFYRQDRYQALRAFLSPSLVHFTSVLTSCLIGVCPIRDWAVLGVLTACVGLFGLCYAALVCWRMMRFGFISHIDLEDRAWYTVLPMVGYGLVTAAGAAFGGQRSWGCVVLAGGLGMLTLAGIRNVWDMTIWTALRRSDE